MRLIEIVRNLYDQGVSTGEIARSLGIAEAQVVRMLGLG